MIFVAGASQVRASNSGHTYLLQANQTPTLGPSDAGPGQAGGTVPVANSTSEAALTATSNAVGPIATGQPQAVPTGGAAPANGAAGGTTTGTTSSGGDFPWLIVVGILVLALAGLAFAFLRPRSKPAAVAVADTPARPGPRTVTTSQISAARAGQAAVPAPPLGTVKCPNCGTVNTTDEKFCHECGQDLRPLIAQVVPVAAPVVADAATSAPPASVPTPVPAAAVAPAAGPVDVVEEDTPYLETLDRVDEQLEYVLSRPRIAIGSASGNDIVIDPSFKGAQTVSPTHAELRRDQDGFVIVDRGSQYGTFVNEMRTGENILSDGDLVRLGDVRFIFRVPQAGQ